MCLGVSCQTLPTESITNYHVGMSLKGVFRFAFDSLFRPAPQMLEPGQTAPDFEAMDQNGTRVKLSELRGSNVVLWFFPKAGTPG